MDEVMDSLYKNFIWALVNLLKKKAIGSKWMLTKKDDQFSQGVGYKTIVDEKLPQ